jgi:hypothetical protein
MEYLSKKHVAAKFVPQLLSQEQKEFHTEVTQDLLEPLTRTQISQKKVITGDESWVYGYDPETKSQSSQWKSPYQKKAQKSRSNVKVMLTVF